MRPRLLTPLLVLILGLGVLFTPRPADATCEAGTMKCNDPKPWEDCEDEEAIDMLCTAFCPNYLASACGEGWLWCLGEPE